MTLQPITAQTTAAKERADAIRSGIDAIADALEPVPRLIIEARKADDWRTLPRLWRTSTDGTPRG